MGRRNLRREKRGWCLGSLNLRGVTPKERGKKKRVKDTLAQKGEEGEG